jgi:hypothetical protein
VDEKRGLAALAPSLFLVSMASIIILSRDGDNPYEIYPIEKKKLMAFQPALCKLTPLCITHLDVMRLLQTQEKKQVCIIALRHLADSVAYESLVGYLCLLSKDLPVLHKFHGIEKSKGRT